MAATVTSGRFIGQDGLNKPQVRIGKAVCWPGSGRNSKLAGRLSRIGENPQQQAHKSESNGSYHTGSPTFVKLATRHKTVTKPVNVLRIVVGFLSVK
jgi:hypothetical protein